PRHGQLAASGAAQGQRGAIDSGFGASLHGLIPGAMREMNPATAATRVAIEFLTLFLEGGRQRAAAHIEMALADPDGPDAASIIGGQCYLSMVLILELAKAQGSEDLHERTGDILRQFSVATPR